MSEETLKKVLDCYKEARQSSSKWREEAKELYAFRAGHQWSDEDVSYLEEQGRPPITFNRAGTIIDAVCGAEISNRQETRYIPRTQEDGLVTEGATRVGKWVRDNCDAEDEDSDAIEDLLISGMGWTETRIDYDEDPEGKVFIDRVDPLEMYWDPAAKKHNLADSTWFIREKWMANDDIRFMWPDSEITPTQDSAPDLDIHNADPPFYERESTGVDKKRSQARILEYHYCEREQYHRVQNPLTGEIETVSGKDFKKLQERFPEIRHAKLTKKVWKRVFVGGNTVLEEGPAPIEELSSFRCITGKRDRKRNCWFGLMRGMKEPQEWANKFFSQVLHIINSNSKGGFFYETGALKDIEAARQDLAKPEGMVELNPGGLGRIKERQMFQFPAGIDRMMEFAISSIRDVPGVNLELLGATDREQPGILEAQRQKQALTVLAPIFANIRRYRKEHGRLLLAFIREFIPVERLQRVLGPELAMVAEVIKSKETANFDVVVEQSATSPNAKTEAWVAMQAVLPMLMDAGFKPPREILDILPIPETISQKWKEQSEQGLPPEVEEAMGKMEEDLKKLSEENLALKQDQQTKMIELDMKQRQAEANLGMQQQQRNLEQERAVSDMQLKREIASEDIRLEIEKMQAEFQMKREQMENEDSLKRQQMDRDHQLRLIEIQRQSELDQQKLNLAKQRS